MKVAVLGGTSGIGRNLIDLLAIQSNVDITLFHRAKSDLSGIPSTIKTVETDLTTPFYLGSYETVYNCTGNVSHLKCDRTTQWTDNVTVVRNIVGAANEADVKNLIHLSTGATHRVRHLDEDALLAYKDSWYIKTKRLGELETEWFKGKTVIISPTICLGKHDRHYVKMFDYIASGGKMVFPGSMGFVSSYEVAMAMVNANRVPPDNYIVTSSPRTWLRFHQIAADMIGVRPPKRATPIQALRLAATIQEALARWKTPEITHEFLELMKSYEFGEEEIKKSRQLLFNTPCLESLLSTSVAQWLSLRKD